MAARDCGGWGVNPGGGHASGEEAFAGAKPRGPGEAVPTAPDGTDRSYTGAFLSQISLAAGVLVIWSSKYSPPGHEF